MPTNFHFDPIQLNTLIGGMSTLEIPKLSIQNLEQAYDFIRSYGYDVFNADDEKKLWSFLRRAVTYIQTELLEEGEAIPSALSDPNQLKDIAYILIYASTQDNRENSLQRWACAILKVMHALVHLENDLFFQFSHEIQDQIFKPIQKHIYSDAVTGTYLGAPSHPDAISLKKFEVKPFKRSDSAVTKLLAKPNVVAFTILDKMGVRFITSHLFDSFQVLRFLVEKNVISVPHNIPDQSNNTLYPLNYFMEVMESLQNGKDYLSEEIDQLLIDKLEKTKLKPEYLRKENAFTDSDYRFIKFITRRLIRVESDVKAKPLTFFYPYEIQIVDYKTYLNNMKGKASHDQYKVRQKRKARLRVMWNSKGEVE